MRMNLRSLFLTSTGKDTSIVLVGTLLNVIAGGLFFIIAPRILGPSDYGLFSTVLSTALAGVAIANFGIDTGILRFAATNDGRFDRVLTLAFKSYLILGLLTSILGFFLSSVISNFFQEPLLNLPLKIAFSSVLLLLITNFYVAGLQAKGQYLKASILNISSNITRLVILGFSIYFFKVDIILLTVIFFLVPLVSIVLGMLYLSFKFQKESKRESLKFHRYNFWIAASLIVSSIPFDNYFLLKLTGSLQTGLYAAPFKVLTACYQLGGNFTRVLASRFSSFDSDTKTITFAKKSIVFPLIFSSGLVLLMIASPQISRIFGKEYLALPQILNILSIGFIFFFLSTLPSSIILYYFGKSQVSFIITLCRYLFFVILLTILIPKLGAIGAALAFTLSEFTSFLMMTSYVLVKLTKVK